MGKIAKLFCITLLGAASFKPIKADTYPGCDCASVVACETAACLVELPLGCIVQGGRFDAICTCKYGAMAHCTNWESDLKNCTKDTVALDLKCDRLDDFKKKNGETYDKMIEASTKALEELQSKQKPSPSTPPSTSPSK